MRYLSVCSGIEAATVAWSPLGFHPVAFAEVDAFPSAVLAHHYPEIPNRGDLTRFRDWPDATVDVLVGGTPCQSFSVAGLRAGLADPRGNLALTYLAVLDRYRPRWCCWENVPGVLSADDGRALGAFLGGLSQLGYGWAYGSLDAQYFGLAQRRQRVFVVGHLGDWRRAAAVLFERESLSGHPPPRREAGEDDPAGTLRSTDGGLDCDHAAAGQLVAVAVSSKWSKGTGGPAGDECYNLTLAHALRADGVDASEDGTGRGTPIVPIDLRQASRGEKVTNNRSRGSGGPAGHGVGNDGDPAFTVSQRGQAIAFSAKDYGADAGELAPTLRAGTHDKSHANGGVMPAIAFHENQRGEVSFNGTVGAINSGGGKPGQGYPAVAFAELADPVAANQGRTYTREGTHNFRVSNVAIEQMQVRRLTPRECERLQGFPDDYTLIPYRGKLAKDGPRYKALGNSMAVPVMRWIGQRMQLVEAVPYE